MRQNSSDYLLRFLISSVFSVLSVRLILHLNHYHQIVFGSWHIAHLFWGGLLMLVSFILIFLYPAKKTLRIASILAGLGWGQYIDELGKYISRDNNYFFRPAIILIYISFVLIFIVYRFSKTRFQTTHVKVSLVQSFFIKLTNFRSLFLVLAVYSLYYSFDKIFDLYIIFTSTSHLDTIYNVYQNYNFLTRSDNYLIFIKIGSDIISALLILLGWFFYLTRRRKSGLKLFQMSLMVNIFIGAVIKFYFEQFSAVFSLAMSIAVFNYVQSRSKLVK